MLYQNGFIKSLRKYVRRKFYFHAKQYSMIQKGTQVKWKWGNGTAEGKVIETYSEKVTKTIKGNEVTRNGESGNKALYIEQEDGDKVLKSESEVERAD